MVSTKEQRRKNHARHRKEFGEYIEKIKQDRGMKCKYCGYNKCTKALHFHHRDPKTKKFTMNKKQATRSKESIDRELEKCDLICANCHIEAHFKLGDWYNGKNQFI